MPGVPTSFPARTRTESELEYLIQLDVTDFTQAELSVEAFGSVLTIRGDQAPTPADEGRPFRIHEAAGTTLAQALRNELPSATWSPS